ncbi:isocitrate dehydrogenase [NAD] catalytic subunit 5, mitochondrial-like isoform X2 [Chenopodium quinoa]|uniref:isocitrate dehydrogenase [NAD] catalytic subunit 5, mitochondrial-like isoform X2 n=1 Tax=Chenopodium quinoa TaxID=63459 RepID=UPI000B783314|nr:isocitrate dehydrogenase [NAD] catalytic subunit 5, mitochondrial-like isoform X2 [Chenopodium quinoa]
MAANCERLFNCYSRCLAGPAAAAVVAACGGYWSQFSTGAPITATLFPGDGIDPEIAESIKQVDAASLFAAVLLLRCCCSATMLLLLLCYYAAAALLVIVCRKLLLLL